MVLADYSGDSQGLEYRRPSEQGFCECVYLCGEGGGKGGESGLWFLCL